MDDIDRQTYPIRRVLINHDRTYLVEWYETEDGEILSPSLCKRLNQSHLWGPPESLKEEQ